MYKVMIVDDEPFVRTGFKMSVDWKKYGFEVSAEASNGREALAEMGRCCPDVVFTDIKMPVMDGIELIRAVRKDYPSVVSIVLSNYDEFDLVKQAMKAGAEDYFLKVTIDIDKLITFMEGLKSALQENRASRLPQPDAGKRSLSFFVKEANPVNFSNVPTILEDDRDLPELRGAAFLLTFQAYSAFVEKRCGGDLSKAMKLLSSTVCSAVTCSRNALILFERDKWILLMNGESVLQEEVQRSTAGGIRFALQQYLGLNCSIGYGIVYRGKDGMMEILNRGDFYFSRAFFQENAFRLDFSGKRNALPFSPRLEEWNQKIGRLQLRDVRAEVEDMVKKAEKSEVDPQRFKEYVIRLLMMLELKLSLYGPAPDLVGSQDYIGKIYGAGSSAEVRCAALDAVDGILKQIRDIPDHHRHEMVQAVHFIEEHFGEKITLQDTADHIHISRNYLSAIFKTECGLSFQNYLIKFRMEKAAQLLLSSDLRVSEICEKVGYGDLFYFDRSFKKYFGQSPKELRDSVRP